MRINKKKRDFTVGIKKIKITHKANIFLSDNEMVTFIDKRKMSYDIVKKSWGYYATPSINGRLRNNKFKTALVSNEHGKIFIMLVEKNNINKFKIYCKNEKQKIIIWLDDNKKTKKMFNLSEK